MERWQSEGLADRFVVGTARRKEVVGRGQTVRTARASSSAEHPAAAGGVAGSAVRKAVEVDSLGQVEALEVGIRVAVGLVGYTEAAEGAAEGTSAVEMVVRGRDTVVDTVAASCSTQEELRSLVSL